MRASTLLAMSAVLSGNSWHRRAAEILQGKRRWKDCLTCGEPHQHNNSFCSAECCKSYRKEGK